MVFCIVSALPDPSFFPPSLCLALSALFALCFHGGHKLLIAQKSGMEPPTSAHRDHPEAFHVTFSPITQPLLASTVSLGNSCLVLILDPPKNGHSSKQIRRKHGSRFLSQAHAGKLGTEQPAGN